MDGTGATTGYIVVGAFDDVIHATRAEAGLRAVSLRFEQILEQSEGAVRPPEVERDTPEHRRATVFGGAFVGAVAVGLLALGAIPLLGLGPATGVGVALAAIVGAPLGAIGGRLLGAPSAARATPSRTILLHIRGIEGQDVPRVRALLARDGASRTWSYLPPPKQAVPTAGVHSRGV